MKWLLIIPLLCVNWLCQAQEGIYVPDPALREILQKQGFMNGDTIFTQPGLLQLNISSSNIHDLTGLRAFPDLRYLDAAANKLTEINDLPPKLISLSCFNNQIEKFDFEQISAPLEKLNLGQNPLHTLLNLPNNLQFLNLYNCQLNNLHTIKKWPDSLRILNLNSNLLDSIPMLPGRLQSLYISNCQFRRLPAFPATVDHLNYAGNPIDTALLPKDFKNCPCTSTKQNCWPAERTRWNLLHLPSDTFGIEEFDQIQAISISMMSVHGWGFGNDSTEIFYERQGDFFRTTKAFHKFSGIIFSERRGEGAHLDSVWFERKFSAQQLFNTLYNLRLPKLQLDERDFGYEKSKFKIDLSRMARYDYESFGCEDCTQYSISIQLIEKDGSRSVMGLGFYDYLGFSPEGSTSLTIIPLKETLEWIYLYQLSHLFFPENIAFNHSRFNEKSIESLATWAKKVFPELNKE